MSEERISDVQAGDRFWWNAVAIRVKRVAKDGSWADIHCRDGAVEWTKRQKLPMPEGIVRVPEGTVWVSRLRVLAKALVEEES